MSLMVSLGTVRQHLTRIQIPRLAMSCSCIAMQIRRLMRSLEASGGVFSCTNERAKGGRVLTHVHVDSVTGQHPKVYLRLLLVEDSIRLRGDGIDRADTFLPRLKHHMVVRAVAHRPPVFWALSLQVPGTVNYTFDVAALQRRHLRYYKQGVKALAQAYPVSKEPRQKRDMFALDSSMLDEWTKQLKRFPDEQDWRMNPTRLHIVAYIQDARTGEILQAAMVPVDAGWNGKRLVLP